MVWMTSTAYWSPPPPRNPLIPNIITEKLIRLMLMSAARDAVNIRLRISGKISRPGKTQYPETDTGGKKHPDEDIRDH